jgi:Fe-S oxidoreductase
MLPGAAKTSPGVCCGAGSGLMIHDRLLADTKAQKVTDSSQVKIVTYCPFCYMSLTAVKPDGVSDIYMLLDARG